MFSKLDHKIFLLDLGGCDLLVFFAILKYADDNGFCFPSYRKISSTIGGMSDPWISKSLKTLIRCNVLIIESGGTGRSNRYRILGSGCWSKKQKALNQVNGLPLNSVKSTTKPSEGNLLTQLRPSRSKQLDTSKYQKPNFSSSPENGDIKKFMNKIWNGKEILK